MHIKISEVNLSAFIYRLFHEDFSFIVRKNTVDYTQPSACLTVFFFFSFFFFFFLEEGGVGVGGGRVIRYIFLMIDQSRAVNR